MSKTPFMPLWVSDFIGDTQLLDATETGAYLLLIMAQWQRGGASLPSDQKKLQRIAKCGRTWPSVWAAISRYFKEDADGVFNPKGREVFQNVAAKREANSQNGARGGTAKALNYKSAVLANATISPERKATILEPEPDKEDREVNLSRRRVEPWQTCMDHFNEVADRVGWPRVQKPSSARCAALYQRIKEIGSKEAWCEAIDRASLSPLLTGQNGRGWRADFDWLCKATNFTKLMEGNYDPRTNHGNGATHQRGQSGPHDSMVAAFAYVAGREPH